MLILTKKPPVLLQAVIKATSEKQPVRFSHGCRTEAPNAFTMRDAYEIALPCAAAWAIDKMPYQAIFLINFHRRENL